MREMDLPEHWKAVRLGDYIFRPEYGYTASATHDSIGAKFLRITDIQDSGVNWRDVPYCKCDEDTKKKYLLVPGDIVIARIGATTGKAFLVDECPESIFASYLIRVKTKSPLLSPFLSTYFRTEDYWRQIRQNKGGRLKGGVNIPILQTLKIPLPPLPEQRAIAHILQTIQEAKAARQRELALERERKAALMDYLFSCGTKDEPRKQTEIGEIPESWKLGTIGEICERIIDYRGRTPKFSESGIVHLRSSNVKGGRLTLKNDEITYVTDETYKSFMTRGLPKAGDIIFTTEGPLGESAMVPPNFRFSLAQRMVLLRADKTVLDSSYLLYVLYSEQVRKEYLGRATGSTAKGISSKNFQQVQVPLPCLPEQREIAISLTACDAKIVALEQEAEHLDELFHAMLDELMTGQRSAVLLIDSELPN